MMAILPWFRLAFRLALRLGRGFETQAQQLVT
jgi:hypothetical protein